MALEASLLRRHGIEVVEPEFENAISSQNRLRETFKLVAQSAWSADSYERVRKLCEIHRPDVAHVHNFWLRMSPSVHAACRDAGVPTVQSLHNYRIACVNALLLRNGRVCEACVGKVPWRGAVRRCYRGSFWASAAVAGMIVANRVRQTWTREPIAFVTPSDHSRGKLLAAGLPPARTFVKPNFAEDPGEPASAPSTSDYAVFLGRLSREKGVDVLLRAWVRSKLGAYRRLVIAGDGPERTDLEQLAAGLGISPPAVTFTGRLAPEAAQRLLKNSRVLIAPSIGYETFGLVLIEAFAHGRPVIASDLGAFAEVVDLCSQRSNVAAVGVNCTSPELISSLIRIARPRTNQPIIVYPNSGERYDAQSKTWQSIAPDVDWTETAAEWIRLGASAVGGCCRTGTDEIARLRHLVEC